MSVYFIRVGGPSPRIKIGYTGNVERRVKHLLGTLGGQGQFLGHMPGDRSVERHFHEMYRRQRLAGEWFEESDDLMRLIAEIAMPGYPAELKAGGDATDQLRRMDAKFAEDAAEAIDGIIFALDAASFPIERVATLLAPAVGVSQARFEAIRDGKVESVTAAEYTQLMRGPELAKSLMQDAEEMSPVTLLTDDTQPKGD